MVAVLLGVAVAAVTITFGALRGGIIGGERVFAENGGAWGLGFEAIGLDTVRVLIGVVAGATVTATAFVARRFTHSPGIGLFAATLVALDPALLVDGQLAVPAALLRFAAVSSLALALGAHPAFHWLVPIPIIVGALIEPWFFTWGAVLSVILLMRGHIFAAPKHLWDAFVQGIGIPVLLAVPAIIAIRFTEITNSVACTPDRFSALLLLEAPWYGPGIIAVANPLVALGGLAVLIAMAFGALVQVGSTFRLARLPGRIQLRLPGRLGRSASRALWLGALAVVMPVPEVAIILGAVAIALGVQTLMEDAPTFGIVIAGVVAVFAAAVIVRLLPIIAGTASPGEMTAILEWLPWVSQHACGTI